jgi:hypothetical protein
VKVKELCEASEQDHIDENQLKNIAFNLLDKDRQNEKVLLEKDFQIQKELMKKDFHTQKVLMEKDKEQTVKAWISYYLRKLSSLSQRYVIVLV